VFDLEEERLLWNWISFTIQDELGYRISTINLGSAGYNGTFYYSEDAKDSGRAQSLSFTRREEFLIDLFTDQLSPTLREEANFSLCRP
jgi:hypothetical protein